MIQFYFSTCGCPSIFPPLFVEDAVQRSFYVARLFQAMVSSFVSLPLWFCYYDSVVCEVIAVGQVDQGRPVIQIFKQLYILPRIYSSRVSFLVEFSLFYILYVCLKFNNLMFPFSLNTSVYSIQERTKSYQDLNVIFLCGVDI